MTTKSHYNFAVYLLRNYAHFNSDSANAAFIFGCVEPDVNVTTYLKGSLSCQVLRGHNYPNLMPYVKTLLENLQHSEKSGVRYCYRFGKLIHYLTDAFTYPHNPTFTGNLHAHVRYEQETEKIFESTLSMQKKKPIAYEENKLYALFSLKHEQYLEQQPGAETDIQFVLDVIPFVFQSLYIHAGIAHKKEIKRYENSFNI